MLSEKILLKDICIINSDKRFQHHSVLIENGKFQNISTEISTSEDISIYNFKNKNVFLLPGFIDLHVHGAGGADVMDSTPSALSTISKILAQQGSTSWLATTMTESKKNIDLALNNIASYCKSLDNTGAEILGVHLEGPFISKEMAGAQSSESTILPDYNLFKRWQEISNNNIRILTIAPELNGFQDMAQKLRSSKVIISAGHTKASAKQMEEAISQGVSHATHLFNAMTGLHHRNSGAVYPLLLSSKVMAELIVDESEWAINLAWKIKGKQKLLLISDSIRERCNGGTSNLAKAHLLPNGVIAGSISSQFDDAKRFKHISQCSIEDIVQVCSLNPAIELNVDKRKGKIEPLYDADCIIIDDNLNILESFCKGHPMLNLRKFNNIIL